MSLYFDESICITDNTMNHRKYIISNEHSVVFLILKIIKTEKNPASTKE